MICQFCEHTDGCEYTSIPPQIKCIITNKFHYYNDECDIEWTPVKRGKWILKSEAPITGEKYWECSLCGCGSDSFDTVYFTPYCPNCGAKMDLEEGEDK